MWSNKDKMSRLRYIKALTESQREELEEGYRHGKNANVRMHCHAILLSSEGKSVPELMTIFGVRKNTVYDWFNNWEKDGIKGLEIKPGRGRKSKIPSESKVVKDLIKSEIAKNRKKLSLVKAEIERELGIHLHDQTLRRFLKSLTTVGVDFVNASTNSKTKNTTKKK